MVSLPKQSQNRWRGLSSEPHKLWEEAACRKMMAHYHPAIATERLAQIYTEALA
ncbi:MAG: hypothetical protein WA947_14105 [Phormidesmis sp.]